MVFHFVIAVVYQQIVIIDQRTSALSPPLSTREDQVTRFTCQDGDCYTLATVTRPAGGATDRFQDFRGRPVRISLTRLSPSVAYVAEP